VKYHFLYKIEWIEDELQKISKKAKDIDTKILNNQDLIFPRYSLPEGLYTFVFKLTVKDKENSSAQYNLNINSVNINTSSDLSKKHVLTIVYEFSVM